MSLSFEDSSSAHASADAHGNDTESLLGSLEFVHQGADHAAARHSEGMAKGDGTTLRVQLSLGDSELVDGVSSLGGEGLVDLENVDVVDGKTAVFEGGRDGESGANSHDLRWDTSDGEGVNAADNLAAVTHGNVSSGEEDAGGTIGNLGGVSGSSSAILLESGLELAETSDSGLRSDSIVLIDCHSGLIAILVLNSSLVGSDLSLEKTRLLGGIGLHVALKGELILLFTGDTEFSSDILGSDSHRHEAVVGGLAFEDCIAQKIGVDLVRHGRVGHRLEATTDSDVDLTGADSVCNRANSLETGRAKTVDSGNTGGVRVASHEHGHASVGASGARVEHVADNNILNEGLVDSGLLGHGLEAGLKHGFKTSVLLGTLLCAGHGSTGHTDDDDVVVTLGADATTIVACLLCEVSVYLVESLHFL